MQAQTDAVDKMVEILVLSTELKRDLKDLKSINEICRSDNVCFYSLLRKIQEILSEIDLTTKPVKNAKPIDRATDSDESSMAGLGALFG